MKECLKHLCPGDKIYSYFKDPEEPNPALYCYEVSEILLMNNWFIEVVVKINKDTDNDSGVRCFTFDPSGPYGSAVAKIIKAER